MDKKKNKTESTEEDKKFPGYPHYPESEDIFKKEKEEGLPEEDNLEMSEGLDVPGSELDDKDEAIGEEDEENNYYSIGGDNHNDLEEDKDE